MINSLRRSDPDFVESGEVDTFDFLKWIQAGWAPWLWSYSLNGWIYCPEEQVTDVGAWIYVMK